MNDNYFETKQVEGSVEDPVHIDPSGWIRIQPRVCEGTGLQSPFHKVFYCRFSGPNGSWNLYKMAAQNMYFVK